MAYHQPSVSEIMRRLSEASAVARPPRPAARLVPRVLPDWRARLLSHAGLIAAAGATAALLWWTLSVDATVQLIRSVAAERRALPPLPDLAAGQLTDSRSFAGLLRIHPQHQEELTRQRALALVDAGAWDEAQALMQVLERELPTPWPADLALGRVVLLVHQARYDEGSAALRAIVPKQLSAERRRAAARLRVDLERRR